MKSIIIDGRVWFSRDNTPHIIGHLFIDGKYWGNTGIISGYYQSMIGQFAAGMLEKVGLLPGFDGRQALWRYCSDHDIYYHASVVDVARKKDLGG